MKDFICMEQELKANSEALKEIADHQVMPLNVEDKLKELVQKKYKPPQKIDDWRENTKYRDYSAAVWVRCKQKTTRLFLTFYNF